VHERHSLLPVRRRVLVEPPPPSCTSTLSRACATTPASSLGPGEPTHAAPCPALRRPSPDYRPPRPPLGCTAVSHRRPFLRPDQTANRTKVNPLALLRTFPDRERRRIAGFRLAAPPSSPWATLQEANSFQVCFLK
jgi:hypothetical protein